MIIDKLENYMNNIKIKLYRIYYNIQYSLEVKKYKRIYPDYIDDEYNNGSLKFIWGITSWDDLTGKDASLFTMNDIDIIYDRDTKLYNLSIETIYMFEGNKDEEECKYLRHLLDKFSKYMDNSKLSKNCKTYLAMYDCFSAKSIEELYFKFRVFVEGYCKVCGC